MIGSESSHVNVLRNQAGKPWARYLFAHGAGAPMDSSVMTEIATGIAQRGVEVLRFEFPYMAARRSEGKRRPLDRTERLLVCWDEIIAHYAGDRLPLFIGGKSMGGRMATLWATEKGDGNCRGIVCFGYPFHPAGKPEKLRVEHLANCNIPLLIVQGERDPLGSREEVSTYGLTSGTHLYWLTAANHDLKPLRSSGFSHAQHIKAAADAAADFMRGILLNDAAL